MLDVKKVDMKRLLYINNYNCSNKHSDGYPDQHLWGADALSKVYDVTCAEVPSDLIKIHFKGVGYINGFWKNLKMLIKYFNYDIVYSACSELTYAFALANILHMGKRKLFKIHHHGSTRILFPKGYTKILFLSSAIRNFFPKVSNCELIAWGGQQSFVDVDLTSKEIIYDFISIGKSGRDHACMAKALDLLDAKSVIITSKADFDYDHNKIKVIGGNDSKHNSLGYKDSYRYYSQSKFICIPTAPKYGKARRGLNGLTSFVDAVVMHKPVLISDNTNMGIDVESLCIGFTYKAGNANDMRNKMRMMLNLSVSNYNLMCNNMAEYSKTHNYSRFCDRLLKVIAE